MRQLAAIFFLLFTLSAQAQISNDSLYKQLHIDTNYAYFQFTNPEVGARFLTQFENVDSNEVVIFHYGGSHIQAGRPTKVARKMLQENYGDGGLGMIYKYQNRSLEMGEKLYRTGKSSAWRLWNERRNFRFECHARF